MVPPFHTAGLIHNNLLFNQPLRAGLQAFTRKGGAHGRRSFSQDSDPLNGPSPSSRNSVTASHIRTLLNGKRHCVERAKIQLEMLCVHAAGSDSTLRRNLLASLLSRKQVTNFI